LRIFKEQDKIFSGVKSIEKRGIYFRIRQILVGHRDAPDAFRRVHLFFCTAGFYWLQGQVRQYQLLVYLPHAVLTFLFDQRLDQWPVLRVFVFCGNKFQ
jgi:hypothetical protein